MKYFAYTALHHSEQACRSYTGQVWYSKKLKSSLQPQNSHCIALVKISCTSTVTSESLWGEGTVSPLSRRHPWLLCQEMMGSCSPCLLRETCSGLSISHRLWMPHNLWLDSEEKFLALFFTALATSFPYYDSVLFAKGRPVICCLIILSCLDMIKFFFSLSLISPSITFFVNCYLSSSKPEMKNVLNDFYISLPKIKWK